MSTGQAWTLVPRKGTRVLPRVLRAWLPWPTHHSGRLTLAVFHEFMSCGARGKVVCF